MAALVIWLSAIGAMILAVRANRKAVKLILAILSVAMVITSALMFGA